MVKGKNIMVDVDKVTKGLECHHIDKMNRINCADCPYREEKEDSNFMSCENKLHDDALELLKEYKRQDGCPCTHCMEWECDEVCEEYKKWKDS